MIGEGGCVGTDDGGVLGAVVSIPSGLADAGAAGLADARAAVSALSARLLFTPTESFSVLNGQDMMLSLRHTFFRDVEQMPCTEHTRSNMLEKAPAAVRRRSRNEEHSGAGAGTFQSV